MRGLRVLVLLGAACALLACSSSSSGGASNGGTGDGGAASGDAGGTSGGSGCTVTFGGDAASVAATSCSEMGPFTSDGLAVYTFTGSAKGLRAPIYAFTIKYSAPVQAKTYATSDIAYVSSNIGVTSTSTDYYVDFDASDATKMRDGSVTTTFTSADHGTIDLTLDSADMPPRHATVHIAF